MSIDSGTVTVPQTLQELMEANQGYLNWLRSNKATEAERDFIESLRPLATPDRKGAIARVYAYAPFPIYAPVEIPFQPPMKEIGGVAVSPYTHRSMTLEPISRSDPLNLVFTGNAKTSRVAEIFGSGLFPPELDWRSTVVPLTNCAKTQWTYIKRENVFDYEGMGYTIAMGGCFSNPRCHIRLFDGGYAEELGEFTLANVHYEHFGLSKIDHIVDDWDRAQAFVQHLFEATTYCRSVRIERFQNQEKIQNVPNDGLASIIDLE